MCHGNLFLTCNWKYAIKYDICVKFPQIFAHNVQICAKFSCKNFTDVCPVFWILCHYTWGWGIFFLGTLYYIDCYRLLLLGIVIWKLVWRKPHPFSQECDGGWQKDVASDWFSWLCFLQCFDVGCMTGKPSAPQKNACDFSPKVPFRNRWWKKTSWELIIQGPPGKQPLKWRWDHCWALVTDTVGEPVSVSCWGRNEVQAVVFTARRYASAVLAVVVCPSVCPSVCHKPVLYRNGNT